MKKLIITFFMVVMSLFVFANDKNVTPQFYSNQTLVHVEYNDSTKIFYVEENVELQYCENFYDIEYLEVRNIKGNRVLVTDMSGKVIIDTTDSINMAVPQGNYKVYSYAKLTSKYKQR